MSAARGYYYPTDYGTVAREPSLEVYRAVREAYQILIASDAIRVGKGLKIDQGSLRAF